jgi:glucose-1-phosphate thymidylyltransferase
LKAIVLAAGYATRLYPLTKDKPKALLDIGGRKMLDYLMDNISSAGCVDEVIIVTNHRFAGQFQDWAEQCLEYKMKISVVDDMTTDNDNRLGAIGDIQYAIEHTGIDDDLLVAASDNFFTFGLNEVMRDFRRHGRDTIMAKHLGDTEDCTRFAIAALDEDGRVIDLEEKPEHPKSDLAVFALYVYRRDTLPMFKQYLDEGNNPDSPGHFPEWLYKRREVRAHVFEGECVDIGTHEALSEIRRIYENK